MKKPPPTHSNQAAKDAIDSSLYGRIERAPSAEERLKLCREAGLYLSISLDTYTPERVQTLLVQARITRYGDWSTT